MPRKDENRSQHALRAANRMQNQQLRGQNSTREPKSNTVGNHISSKQRCKSRLSTSTGSPTPGTTNSTPSHLHVPELPNDNPKETINSHLIKSTMPEVIQINMNGMKPNQAQKWRKKSLKERVETKKAYVPFVIVTETYFKPKHNSTEISIKGYNVQRGDRSTKKKKGGFPYVMMKIWCQLAQLLTQITGVYRPSSSKDNEK